MNWRLAKSLETLRKQVNTSAPGRDKGSDGTIGDAAHQRRKSDHNPNSRGVVQAIDFTHSPDKGFDAGRLAETLRANRDRRIKYIIWNGRISNPDIQDWKWRPSRGHEDHIHISVKDSPSLYDDDAPWNLGTGTSLQFMQSGKGSWYSWYKGKYNWRDPGDKRGSNLLGVPDDQQGVAFYNRATLGKWFVVTAPNGKVLTLRQTDVGPHPRTGRKIDIAAVAAEAFGYSPSNFPTDGIFHWYQLGSKELKPPTPGGSVILRALAAFWRMLNRA